MKVYRYKSHNIIDKPTEDVRIFYGPFDIAKVLSELPLTTHLKRTFTIDFNLVTVSNPRHDLILMIKSFRIP